MFSLLDIVPEPTQNIAETARSIPWIAAYIVIGALVCIAVFLVINKIVKMKNKK